MDKECHDWNVYMENETMHDGGVLEIDIEVGACGDWRRFP